MGIRFYCPNGHRLHVKSFLAGKRGICPHCTSRFQIPRESEIPRGAPKVRPNSIAAAGRTNGKQLVTSDSAESSVDALDESKPVSQAVSPGNDPIAEAPEAVWYVRPPSGGQYGPAKGDVMRRWLAEGRVSADSLVWREGWSDWLTAGPVFPLLNPAYTAAAAAPTIVAAKRETVSLHLQPATQLQTAGNESPGGARSASVSARSVTHQKSLAPVIILVLTVIVLIVVLVIVLTTRQ